MNEEKVEKAKAYYSRIERTSKYIIIIAYLFAFLGFLMAIPLISMERPIELALLFIAVIITPAFVAQFAEGYRMHAILKLTIAILQYIDDNNEIKPIPVEPGKFMPLGHKSQS